MLTSKQRAFLRAKANMLYPIFQIGKEGVSENLLKGLDEALTTRELIKVTILESAGITARQASDIIKEALDAEPVQCIGRKIVFYRESEEHKLIELP